MSIPNARTNVSETAGALALDFLDTVCVFAPVRLNADMQPRVFGSAQALISQHDYSEGAEYVSAHIRKTKKPVMFVGMPIGTAGAVGRFNTTGNSGTSVVSVTAGADGCLTEHDGVLRVVRGGTVGTDQILLELSLDGGRKFVPVRLGTSNSYTPQYLGASLAFAAGTLVAGDTVLTWHGSGPRIDTSDLEEVRTNLAAQQRLFRNALLIGDVDDAVDAAEVSTMMNAYKDENDRATRARVSLADRLPLATLSIAVTRMTGNPALTFAEVGATGDTITRGTGSWIADGFQVGDYIRVTGSASNNVSGKIASLSATVITLDTTDLVNEGPVSNVTVTAEVALTFANSGDTITRNRGSWLTDGFRVGDSVTVTGTSGGTNDGTFVVQTLTALVMTLASGGVDADEVAGVATVGITAGQTKTAWMAALAAEFEDVTDDPRIELCVGRGRMISTLSGWLYRRPSAWAISIRNYQHDIHVPTWRKDLGNLGAGDWSLADSEGVLVEWDDRVDGEAASDNRFSSLRTWANGPSGTFITLSLTRAEATSIQVDSHNADVVNLVCSIVQAVTENFVGRTPEINADGTLVSTERNTLESEANSALKLGVLKNARGEGKRASQATSTVAADDVLNVPQATLNVFTDLLLNGTIFQVVNTVRVRSGGE